MSVCDSDYAGSDGKSDGFESGGDGSGILSVEEGEAKAPLVNQRRKGRASLLAWLEIASTCAHCKSSIHPTTIYLICAGQNMGVGGQQGQRK